jgi:fructose-1,6-bisphosphatase/inositol monophosphatase family enzyme
VPIGEAVGCVSATYFRRRRRSRRCCRGSAGVKIFANYRCAGHEYRLLASGGTHFSMYSKLMPWDHLAGCLLVAEAGGSLRQGRRCALYAP